MSSSRTANTVYERTKPYRYVILGVAVVLIVLTVVSTSGGGVFGSSEEGGRIGTDGLDHDSAKALKAARNAPKHISFELHTDRPYRHMFSEHACFQGRVRHALPDTLAEPLNYTATVTTNYKMMFLGDPQVVQISEAFQEAAGVEPHERTVFSAYGGAHEAALHVGTTDDYGIVAGYRTDQYLLEQSDHQHWGWQKIYNFAFLNYSMPWNEPVGSYDVMVFKPPQLDKSEELTLITNETLKETMERAGEFFGISTVILMTLPMHKEYKTLDDLALWEEKNELLRTFAAEWQSEGSVKHIYILEFGELTKLVVEENAKTLDMDTSNLNYLLLRVNEGHSKPAVAHVCGAEPIWGAKYDKCQFNMLAADGQFWCMETLGGRLVAGIACLLACPEEEASCRDQCNRDFMGIETPLDDYELGP